LSLIKLIKALVLIKEDYTYIVMEQFKSPEGLEVSEEQVIETLRTKGMEDPEAQELLGKFVDQVHAEADKEALADPTNADASNRANIQAQIRIISVYSHVEALKGDALEALTEVLIAAMQDESTKDLMGQTVDLIAKLRS
jgi:hypothetical protein